MGILRPLAGRLSSEGDTVTVNVGQFDGATVYPYPRQFTMYLTVGIVNTIEVFAVDEAGNRSAPATMTIDMRIP